METKQATIQPTDNLKRLHENLSKKDGFSVPYDQFQADMQDENNLKRLHDNLTQKDGFNVPFDQFKTDMFGAPVSQPETMPREIQPIQQPIEVPAQESTNISNNIDPNVPNVESGFNGTGKELGNRAHRSAMELNKMLANTPDYINRLAVEAFNASAGKGVRNVAQVAGWLGFDEIAKKYKNWRMEAKDLKPEVYNAYNNEQKEILTDKIAALNPKHEQGIVESAKQGDWTTFTRNLAGGVADSFAPSIAMMVSGGSMGTVGMIGSGTAVFGAGKYMEMDEQAPELPESMKVFASAANGALEGIFETYLGSGAVGGALRNLIAKEGREVGQQLIKNGLRKGFSDLLTKYPALAPLGEGFEEWGTQISQNYVDKISGYRPDINVFEGATDAMLIGIASGAAHTAPLYGAKAIMGGEQANNSPSETPVNPEQPLPTVDPQQEMEAIRNQFQAETEARIKNITHKSGQGVVVLRNSNTEVGKEMYVVDNDLNDAKGTGLLEVVYEDGTPAGKNGFIHIDDASKMEWVTTAPEEALRVQMGAFDAELQRRMQPQVGEKIPYNGQEYIIAEDLGDNYLLMGRDQSTVEVPKQELLLQQENIEETPSMEVAEPAPPETGGEVPTQPQETIQPPINAEQETPIVQQKLGKNTFDIIEREGYDEIVPTDKMPLEKALPILEKEFENRPKWEVVAEKAQVDVPGETKWDEPTKRTIVKSIRIQPKQQPQAENEMVDIANTDENITEPVQNEIPQPVNEEVPETRNVDEGGTIITSEEPTTNISDVSGTGQGNDVVVDELIQQPEVNSFLELSELLNKYNDPGDEIYTINDFVGDVDGIGDLPVEISDAVREFRRQQEDDEEVFAGRNDMDEAEDRFIKVVESIINQNNEEPAKQEPEAVEATGYERENAEPQETEEQGLAETDENLAKLKELGYTDEQIEKLSPVQEMNIIDSQVPAPKTKSEFTASDFLNEMDYTVIKEGTEELISHYGTETEPFIVLIKARTPGNKTSMEVYKVVSRIKELQPSVDWGRLSIKGPEYDNLTQQFGEKMNEMDGVEVANEAPLFKTPLEKKIEEAEPFVEEKTSVRQAEKAVNTNPTEEQKKAGNYKKGHAKFAGFNITIENPKGSTRSGKDAKGKKWSITMNNAYGYFKRTLGKDGDQVDFFLGPNNRSQKVYVVDQIDQNSLLFDEHKVMLGFNSEQEAREAYLSNYEEGWQGLGAITEMHKNDFKKWLNVSGKKKRGKRKPVSELVQTKRKTKKNSLTPEQVQERKENRAKALNIEPVSLEQLILQYIVQGNRLNWNEIQKEVFPSSRSEMNRRIWMLKGDAPTIDELLVKQGIVSGTTFEQEAHETNVFRNAVLDVVLSNTTQNDMVNRILEIGSNEQADIEAQENALGEAMAAAEKAEIDFANSVWDEYYDQLIKNEEFPSDNELNNLFLLDNGTEESNTDQGTVQGENERDSSTESPGGRQVVEGGSSRNATQATPEEVNPNQEKIDKAQTELKTLQSRLKKKEAEINSRNGIFGDTASKPGGLFVDEQFDMANAQQVVEGIKAEITKKEQEIEQLTKAGETAAKENSGQQEIVGSEQSQESEESKPNTSPKKITSFPVGTLVRFVDARVTSNATNLYYTTAGTISQYNSAKGHPIVYSIDRSRPEGVTSKKASFVQVDESVLTEKQRNTYQEYANSKSEAQSKNQFKTPLEQKIEEAGKKVSRGELMDDMLAYLKKYKGESLKYNPEAIITSFMNTMEINEYMGTRPEFNNRKESVEFYKDFSKLFKSISADNLIARYNSKNKKRKSFTEAVKKNLSEKDGARLDELRNQLRNKLGGQLNAGLDPETFMLAAEATGLVIKSGARGFSQYVTTMVDMLGEKITPHLKALYEYTRRADSAEYANEMTPTVDVDNADIDQIISELDENSLTSHKENDDVSDRSGNSEPSSSDNETEVRPDGENVSGNRGGSRSNGNGNSQSGGKRNRKRPGSQGSLDLFTPVTGERGTEQEQNQPESESTRDTNTEGSQSDSSTRNNVERDGNQSDGTDVAANTTTSGSFAERVRLNLIKQREAEDVPVKITDRANISETLPFLLEDQQDDVFKTEKRFNNPEHNTHDRAYGKGMLFTNGTGTGKTYTGLGIVKRFTKQGKNRILIVVPTQPKVTDWIKDGKNLGLNITALQDTKDKGEGTVITTYANMRANLALLEDDFDLVMYDESHRLMEDKKGSPSSTTYTHYNLTNKTEGHALQRIQEVHPLWLEARELNRKIRHEGEYRNNPDLMDLHYQQSVEREEKLDAQLKKVKEQQKEVLPSLEKRAAEAYKRTKVVFLSATPFKMHFNLRYANGYLFDWGEEITYESASRGMSRVDPESRFFLDNFGSAYEWKYHRLQQKSDSNPEAIAMQEVEFAEKLMKQGVMSGRAIESDMDYSREFPKVALANADLFNRGFNDIYKWGDDAEFDGLRDAAREIFYNYNYTTKLFESLKTSMSIPRIQQHIDLGRKVVIFHRRRQAGVAPPFRSILGLTRSRMNAILAEKEAKPEEKEHAKEVLAQCDLFAERYSDLLDYEQTLNYNSAIDQILEEFGSERVRFINGNVSKKDKNQAVKDFNDDYSGVDIIMVQEESGKEGISLHDTTGKHQRALMSLSMPISSITALQIEGRTYRIGNESNAIFEYPLLGLDLEVAAFGQTINRKLSTTENLAVGNQSRDLLRSFAEGVLFNSTTDAPNQEQGQGGKEYDKKELELKSEFQRAKLVYSTNQKQRGRRDQRKGVDYYPTPEPVGQKMVEWLGLREGDEVLEPSAGHGAIAMWFPSNAKGTVIEPSFELFSKLTARTGDAKKVNSTFEDHNIVNKYDGVVMNPPFGQGGSTAIKHIEKAYKHLRPNGRIVALIPNGGSMQKKFDKFLYGEDEKEQLLNPDAYLVAEMELPSVTFEQAGTAVNGKIVVIDKLPVDKTEYQIRQEVKAESHRQDVLLGEAMTPEAINREVARRMAEQRPNIYTSRHNFSQAKTIDELFDEIEYVTIAPRTKPFKGMQETSGEVVEETSTQVEEVEGEGTILHPVEEYEHTKTGAKLYNVRLIGRSDRFKELADIARKHSPYNKRKAYSPYAKGFLFATKEHAIRFRNEVEGNEESPKFRIDDQLKQNLNSADLDKRHAANVELIDHINQLTGNVAETKVVKTVSDLYNDLRAEGVSEKALERLQKEVEQAGERVINGLFFRDKVWIVSENHGKQRNILNTWLHEMTHRIVDSEFTKEELDEIYDSLGKEFIEDNIPNIHHNDPKDKQVHELLAYSYETGANSIESVFNGEVDFEHFPLTLQFATNRITERFKEYGFRETENTKPSGRGTDALQRNSEQESSGQLREDRAGEPGNATAGRTGESQRNVDPLSPDAPNVGQDSSPQVGSEQPSHSKPSRNDYPLLPDYLDALEQFRLKSQNSKVPHTETPEFKKWFGNSKVVDENGKPLVVYHATQADFDTFSKQMFGSSIDTGTNGEGFYFTADPENASTYAKNLHTNTGKLWGESIMPVFLSIQNPADTPLLLSSGNSKTKSKQLTEKFKKKGFDGIIAEGYGLKWFVAFEPNQIKSATGNNGGFDPNNPDIRFSTNLREDAEDIKGLQDALLSGNDLIDSYIEAYEKASEVYQAKEKQKIPLKETLEKMREFWVDMNMPIRRWEETIKKRGGTVTDDSKPYRDMRNMFGRMEALYRSFQNDKMNPIKDAITALVKSGMESDGILPYMIAKHGRERNLHMREMEFEQWMADYEDEHGKKPTPAMRMEKIEKLREKDFSGLQPLDPEKKYRNVTEISEAIVKGFEAKADAKLVKDLWKAVKGATDYTLDTWLAGGQISSKQYKAFKEQYEHFIPLRGWREGAAKYLRYSNNEGGIGRSLKRMQGRKSLADNPFAYIQSVAFKAINEQVSNEIREAAFQLVFNNYGKEFRDLHGLKKAYLVKVEVWNDETQQHEEVWELYRDEKGNLARPPQEMFRNGDVKIETMNDHEKLRTVWHAKQHEVVVYKDGGFSVIVFPDSMLSTAQALNNQNTMVDFMGMQFDARKLSDIWLLRGISGWTNFMKAMMTSYNPVFPFTNFFRDQPEAAITQFIRQNSRLSKMATVHTPTAAKAIVRNMAGKYDAKSNLDVELRNFYEAGGTTGFTHEKRIEQIEKEFQNELKRALRSDKLRGKTIDKLTHVLRYIEGWNRIFEDTTRFAVYMSAREKGLTVRDAAFESRNASVDFNMKGKGTRIVESLFAFFKAGVNALQKNFQLAKNHPGKFSAVAATVATLGFLEAMLNDWGDGDEDEYYRLNDYVRQNYLVFHQFWGDENKYVRVPLPQFWRGFHAMGVSTYDFVKGKKTAGEAVGQTASNMIAGMAPIDVTGFAQNGQFDWSPIVPTTIKPIREAYFTNRNFLGNKVAYEAFTKALEEDLADSGLHKKNVNPAIKFITDMLFKAGGGEGKLKFKITDEGKLVYVPEAFDVNPSRIEHLLNGYFGGVSRFTNDFVTSAWQMISPEEEVDFDNIPFVNSFIRNVPEEKWGILEEYQEIERRIKDADKYRTTARSEMNFENEKKFYHSDYAKLKPLYNSTDRIINTIMQTKGFNSEEAAQEVTDIMKDFIEEVHKTEQP